MKNLFPDITPQGQTPVAQPDPQAQGLSTLLVMIAVLAIILLFCLLGAPGVRDLCKRTLCRCFYPEPNTDGEYYFDLKYFFVKKKESQNTYFLYKYVP